MGGRGVKTPSQKSEKNKASIMIKSFIINPKWKSKRKPK